MKKALNNYRGFTLIELMITLAVAAILLTVGVPSFNEVIRNSRLTTQANSLLTSFNLAKSEAIKRGQPVTVRKAGGNWEDGWTVFTDLDGDGVKDVGDNDTDLRVYDVLPTNFTLRSSGINRVTYQASGISGNGSFVICDNSDNNDIPEANTSRLILINVTGRARIGADSDNDGIPEKEDGTEITSCTVSPFT